VADTGLPWELPYPLPTDLVRDGADAIKDLAEATATGLSAAGNAGIGSNVVQTVKTDTFTTTNTTFTNVTGLAVTITPSSATAKVLVIAQIAYGLGGSATGPIFRMTRDGSAVYVGDAASNRARAVFGGRNGVNGLEFMLATGSIVFLDSPEQATATVYQIQALESPLTGGTVCVNRSNDDGDNDQRVRGASSITAIEVAV
jgi:hypothetical protein